MTTITDKKRDLAGPGIGSYEEIERILPDRYVPLLGPKDTQIAIAAIKRHIEDGLCRALNLIRVEVPLIVDSGCRCSVCTTCRGMLLTQQSVMLSSRPAKSKSSDFANAATCRSMRRCSSAKVGDTVCIRCAEW